MNGISRMITGRRAPHPVPAAAAGERVYAIGDIHGRFDLFVEMLALMAAGEDQPGGDQSDRDGLRSRVVVLGDFIDRGPDSRRLIHAMMKVQREAGALVVLLGNHEALLLDSVAGDAAAQAAWLRVGGLATLDSFGIAPPRDGEDRFELAERLAAGIGTEIVEWLVDLPLSAASGDYYFCHAGIRPGVALDRQQRADMLWIREAFTASDVDHGVVVVHGHTVVEAVEIRANRIAIDTGAYRTGRLTALCLAGTSRQVLTTGPASSA